MKTWKIIAVAAGVVILAFGALGVGVVFAKSVFPAWSSSLFGMGWGYGHMNGSGMMNGRGMMNAGSYMNGIDMDAMHDWMMGPNGMHQQVLTDLATTLGITPDQLNTELQNGKSLAQLAQEKGVSTQQQANDLESSVKAALQKAVADKVLTQQQADAMLQHMNGNYEQMLNFMGIGMGTGVGGCHGYDNDNNTNPSSTSY